ncbi:MAG TPA: TldD/PmbA family protein [Ktedonobacterales bacterium]|nr:TldD/PmbA family protein [Ktedonobacterales bacterium]
MNDALYRVAQDLVAELEPRFPYAAALLSGQSGVQITDRGAEQQANEVPPTLGIVFTIYDGRSFNEYATGTLDPDALAREARAWAAELQPRSGGPAMTGAGYATLAGSDWRRFTAEGARDPATVPLSEKLALARDLGARGRALDQRVAMAQVQYADTSEQRVYIGRGRLLEQHVTRMRLVVVIAVSDGQQMRYHFAMRGGTGGYELADISPAELARTAETALRLLEAEKITPGEYEVISDPSVSGVIAHECFGHGVELDLFPKGRALAARYLDRQVAAPSVQMYDDPSVVGGYGSYFFDDEGELARPTQILRDGVLVRPISDFSSATFAPGIHTANGRRQDYTRKVYARMSNTFFAPGASDPAAMIADVERGVYLRMAESGMEDPAGWGIQVTAHYGEEIVDGALTGRLFAPVGITGYVPDLLRSISAIGNDFELSPGTCGKGHKEMVPVASGGPHLRMKARLG